MNDKFSKRLEEFLLSECSDYDLEYSWKQSEDYEELAEVEIKRSIFYPRFSETLYFGYKQDNDELTLAMSLDSDIYETVKEYDCTVKYFWMKLAPYCFNNK